MPSISGTTNASGHVRTNANAELETGNAIRSYSEASITNACDALQRAEAMFVHLRMVNCDSPKVGPLLEEAQHTYEQALSRYYARDFEQSHEFSVTSRDLSWLVAILISRAIRADMNCTDSMVGSGSKGSSRPIRGAYEKLDLNRLGHKLAWVRWVQHWGALSSDGYAQVRKIQCCVEPLYIAAIDVCEDDDRKNAVGFAYAAELGARAAERLCYIHAHIAPFDCHTCNLNQTSPC